MSEPAPLAFARVDPNDFDVAELDDEIRVDALCGRLLMTMRDHLLAHGTRSLVEVGELCHGVDLFLRDFVIAACGDNLFRLPPERFRQFAGHWYIVNTLEPNAGELSTILAGIAACYELFAEHGLVGTALAAAAAAAGAELSWYCQRIEDYWSITGDGFEQWRSACPLPERRR